LSEIQNKINYLDFSPHPIVGVDEVGRGCIAGPVFAAAVCLKSNHNLEFFTDSKLLSEKRREELSPVILSQHYVGIGSASVEEIDEINILQASLLAMKRAVENLEKEMGQKAGHILVDGNQKIPRFDRKQTTIIKGDLRCAPISAASIVAKVARDHLMKDYAQEWPAYGFEKHKGYGSEFHRTVVSKIGPSPCHRKTFKGVKEFLSIRP
jgi:ribonuclease HII